MIGRRALLLSAASLVARPSFAQPAWPARPVRLVIPFTPGGANDVIGRVVAAQLGEIWGQQVIVENRGGASGNIGSESVARAGADGYTMLLAPTSFAINPFLYAAAGYDPVADFAPVTMLCSLPYIMVVPNSSPAKSVREFIDHAQSAKAPLTFASAGAGSGLHLAGEMFRRMAGIEMTHVPYRGGGQALNDLVPGRIDVMFNAMASTLPMVQAGALRALAVTTAARSGVAPDLPTIAEAALPGFDMVSWFALFVAARTPPGIVAKIHADTARALASPAAKAALENLGADIVASTPESLGATVRATMEKWGPIIREAGIRAE